MPFDGSRALRVKTFCENLKCTQGEWAGRPFILIPWQYEDVIKPLFGTLKDDGTRQYRFCYVEIPKKNGKSPLSAAIGLYMLCADGEASPEVYIAAADREQASYVFRYAAQMARENDVLMKNLKIADSRRRILPLRY
jgi:phage terminase large subunit-like protein